MKKTLIAFGLIWVFVWCIVGMYMGSQYGPYADAMDRLSREGNLAELWDTWNAWKMHAVSHTHAICFAFVSILVALVMPEMRFSDKTKKILGVLLILGVAFHGIFGWFHFHPVMVPAGILVVAMVLMSFVGIMRGPGGKQEA